MKKVTWSLALLFCCTLIYGQKISIDCQLERGSWSHLYQKKQQTVFKLNKNGQLAEILIFETEDEATSFMRRPRVQNKPSQKININKVAIYFESYGSVSYYSPHEHHTGKIKSLNKVPVTYYRTDEHHTGKLKQIGNLTIGYYSPYEHHTGKIKQIGGVRVQYYNPNKYHEGYTKAVGDIVIKYYTPQEYNTGKLKSIGNLKILYFTPQEFNSGKFKGVQGTDPRVKLL